MRSVWLALLILISAFSVARAEIVTRCAGSVGHGWYFAGPFVPQDKSGWNEDAITKGEILLITDGEKPDIVYTDVAGTRSARAEGAGVFFVSRAVQGGFTLVVVVYPAGAMEHYLFKLNEAGEGTVAWGTARAGGLIQKSTLMVSKCRAP